MRLFLLICIPFLLFSADLKKREIEMGGQRLIVEIADTVETRSRGLMGRTSLPENGGMLFVFSHPKVLSFWMKNTLIPLSIGFFDSEQRLLNTVEMVPPSHPNLLRSYKSSAPALFALEMSQGWFSDHQIQPGMKFSFLDPED